MASNTNYEKYKSDGSLQGNLLEWVDARFPATSMWRGHLSEYYAPKNFNFWYFFGSLAMLVLVIQIVTGIFLVMFYKPDASLNANGIPVAFASVEYIMRDVQWGWLIRYMHSTGASAFFVVVYLHMFRGMLYGSYRKPRELIWVFGAMIFLCLMAEAFMGYLLPWGQMSFWGAQVIVNLFSAIPLIGEPLSIWIRGDFVIGDATLNRFFSFHVIACSARSARPRCGPHPGAARSRLEQSGRYRDQAESGCQWYSARRHSVPPLLLGEGHCRRRRFPDCLLGHRLLCSRRRRLLP